MVGFLMQNLPQVGLGLRVAPLVGQRESELQQGRWVIGHLRQGRTAPSFRLCVSREDAQDGCAFDENSGVTGSEREGLLVGRFGLLPALLFVQGSGEPVVGSGVRGFELDDATETLLGALQLTGGQTRLAEVVSGLDVGLVVRKRHFERKTSLPKISYEK